MSRYIDADALLAEINEVFPHISVFNNEVAACIKARITTMPTADVVEVRHGKWQIVDSDIGYVEMECSLCGHVHLFYTNQGYPHCPKCGAKMDGERKDDGT